MFVVRFILVFIYLVNTSRQSVFKLKLCLIYAYIQLYQLTRTYNKPIVSVNSNTEPRNPLNLQLRCLCDNKYIHYGVCPIIVIFLPNDLSLFVAIAPQKSYCIFLSASVSLIRQNENNPLGIVGIC